MKRRSLMQRAGLLALAITGSIVFAACSSSNDTTETASNNQKPLEVSEIKFGIISTESQANQKPLWEPFIKDMEKQIGVPVKPFYVTQYAGVIEAMKAGDVQIAWYGGKSYVEAARRSNAEVFAQTVNDDGSKGYVSHLITHKDSKVATEAKALVDGKVD